MIEYIKKLLKNDKIRYIIVGGCTTLVNMITFFALRLFSDINRNTCNLIAIICAIIFAYFANKFIVFESKKLGFGKTIVEAILFVASRMVSMVVEILGFAILCDTLRINELFSKILVQFVVVVLNYVFGKLVVFKKERRSFRESFADNYCYYVSFALVFATLMVIFVVEGIAPFGHHTITIVDSMHQYIPFYSELRHKLLGEGSLFYSWNIALGSNFLSLMAYYLSSPFNLLYLLVDKEHIVAMACMIIAVKVALTSVAMVHYLSYKDGKKKRNPFIIAVALSYTFSNYIIGYCWNSMWLDCLIAFPLIMLGFKKLVDEGNVKLYILSLFYALYCNYYIGYIICLFLVLWFITYRHGSIKKFFGNGIKFAYSSLIAGGMAMFMLLPAYFGIMMTAAGKMKLPKASWYGNIFVMIKQQFFLTDPITTQTFDGGVNLYCGTLAILGIFLYLISSKVKVYDKIKNVLLLVVLMISFNNVLPNYIWHGMHDQYGIPNRFSFLYIFVLLTMLYDVVKHIKSLNPPLILAGALFAVSATLYCDMQIKMKMYVYVCTIVFIGIYAVVLSLGSTGKLKKTAFVYTLSLLCTLEILVNGISGFLENGYSNINKYYSTSKDVTKAYKEVQELAKADGGDFYRADLVDSTVLDEASWHNMPSVGTFCSTVNGKVVTAMGKLGFYTGANEFLYMGSTPFTNSLLNVRYILEREDDYNNFAYDYIDTVSNVGIYRNPYPLSLGFGVSKDIKDYEFSGKCFDVQNKLSEVMMHSGPFFHTQETSLLVTCDEAETRLSGNTIYYTPDEQGDVRIYVSFFVDTPGDYYLDCRGNSINKIRFSVDGNELTYDRYQIQIFHLGKLKADQYVTVEYYLKDLSVMERNVSLNIATFDENAYLDFYNRARSSLLEVSEFDDGYVKGTINVSEGQDLFTTVPYDKGWTVYVDGKKTKFYPSLVGFIGVELTPGQHVIEMKYTPMGFKLGVLISTISWLLFMLIIAKLTGVNIIKKNNNELTEQ